MTSAEQPFDVLGLAPTLDLAEVKRGYFRALPRHPPHTDPAGFQRLRRAYEALSDPAGLARAFAAYPVEAAAEQARWEARFAAPLAGAAAAVSDAHAGARTVERFVASYARLSLAEALSLAGVEGAGPTVRAP
ncbi:MAG TPA: J domain-containing protein [Polyangia bacterium]|jgi:curved DNA-binding protein CbpA